MEALVSINFVGLYNLTSNLAFLYQLVFVLDPDEEKQYLDRIQHRTKEKSYAFDKAFSTDASNKVHLGIFYCDVAGQFSIILHTCRKCTISP